MHQLGKGIAKQPRNPQRHIHPGSSQGGGRHHLHIHQTPCGAIPAGPHAHQGQGLGDVLAAIAHRCRPPHRQREGAQIVPLLHAVLLQKQLSAATAQIPGRLRRQGTQINAVKVPPRRQHFRPATGGGTGGARRDPSPGQPPQQGLPLGGGTGQQVGLQGLPQTPQRPRQGGAGLQGRRWTLQAENLANPGQGLTLQQGHPVTHMSQPAARRSTLPLPALQARAVAPIEHGLLRIAPGIEIQPQVASQGLGEARLVFPGGTGDGQQQLRQDALLRALAIDVKPKANLGFLEFA